MARPNRDRLHGVHDSALREAQLGELAEAC